jgi:hypothetical protein
MTYAPLVIYVGGLMVQEIEVLVVTIISGKGDEHC